MQKVYVIGMMIAVLLLAACSSNAGASTGSASSSTSTSTKMMTATSTSTNTSGSATTGSKGSTTSSKPTVPLTAIRMLDTTHGWALTASAVLKTSDGGASWKDVSPANNPLIATSTPDFMNAQYAWIAIPPNLNNPQAPRTGVKVLYTADGGVHWHVVTIADSNAVGVARPQFVNTQDGWLEVGTGAAAGSESVDIFATTNGGQNWVKVSSADPQSSSGLPLEGHKTGLSFANTSTGWATGGSAATDSAWLYRTRDGGKTWQSQSLPRVPGVSNAIYMTTPPVIIGSTGLLPVQVNTESVRGLDLYVSRDGCNSWAPTTLDKFAAVEVYALDTQHVWANNTSSFSGTNNEGQSWTALPATGYSVGEISFVDTSNGWTISPIGNNTPLLLHTANGGKTWQKIQYSIQ